VSNIDIEIDEGNPGAVGIRAHYAQHCFLAHMDFHIGSGLAGIHDGGNVAQDVHFYGGEFGIWTGKPSPGWQFTVIDSTFEGQRQAAIREHEAGLTLIRPQFKNVPTAISIDPQYSDELWLKDARLENVSAPAVIISNENNARTEINMENVVCRKVPVFASYRESGKQIAGAGEMYEVKTFSHGLHFQDVGAAPAIQDVYETAPMNAFPKPVKSDLPDLPHMDTWVNIHALGAQGDGSTDDTEVFEKAIAEHRAIYLPSGQYRVTDTITLRPDTVLIGLQPSVTRIFLADSTPAFQGIGSPKPLLETPKDGTNIVTGIGLYTNGINPRAVAAKWMAGRESLMDDVRFLGGHGTSIRMPAQKRVPVHGRNFITITTPAIPIRTDAGTGSIQACGSPAAGLSSTSGRPARSHKRVCTFQTRQPKDEFMNCPASITFATKWCCTMCPTGKSTHSRRRRSGARAGSHCRSRSGIRATSPLRTCTCIAS